MAENRIAFLFGSGISYASQCETLKKPITCDYLTECLFKTQLPERCAPILPTHEIRIFLKQLSEILSRNLDGRKCNYEDLFGAAARISGHLSGELPDPLISNFIDALKSSYGVPTVLILGHTLALIRHTVYEELRKVTEPVGLESISGLAQEGWDIDIFTLNHDCLIEAELQKAGISYADGFSKESGSPYKRFKGLWQETGVNLYKLHGSIDWWLLNQGARKRIVKLDDPPAFAHDDADVFPVFLNGHGIKNFNYQIAIFENMMHAFTSKLATHPRLICCGYGWSDFGVNIRLRQWLDQHDKQQLIILSEDKKVPKPGALSEWNSEIQDSRHESNLFPEIKWLKDFKTSDLVTLACKYKSLSDKYPEHAA